MRAMATLALDPGVTTGYALALHDEHQIYLAYGEEKFTHNELFQLMVDLRPDHLICEGFEFRQGKQKTGVDLTPVEMIGIVKLYTDKCIFQPPSTQGKTAYWSDDKLKETELYDKSYHHGRSAVKHLLHWYTFGSGSQYRSSDDTVERVNMLWLLNKRLDELDEGR